MTRPISHPPSQRAAGFSPRNRMNAAPMLLITGLMVILIAPVARSAPMDQPPPAPAAENNPYGAIIHVSEEASTLLKRAEEGIDRQDWKLAIDSLQRIIELPGEHILSTDGRLFESARSLAVRRLSELPTAGLQAYRLMHDGEADALFKQAWNEHNQALLNTVVERFLLTRVGPQAAVTLADWLIDEGRFNEAANLLATVRSTLVDSDLPDWVIPARLAVALAAAGQADRSRRWLESAAATQPAPGTSENNPLQRIRAWVADQTDAATRPERNAWPVNQGDLARTGRMAHVEPTFVDDPAWRIALPVTAPREGFEAFQIYAADRGFRPVARPVTDGRALYLRAGGALIAVDVESFQPLWTSETDSPGPESVRQQLQARMVWMGRPGDAHRQYDNHPFVLETYRDTVGSSVSLAAGRVLTVEWPSDPPAVPSLWLDDGRPDIVQGQFDTGQLTPNRIAAYDPATGKLLWSTDTAGGEGELAGLQFLAAPVPVAAGLLAPARVQNDLYAVLLDAATGRLDRYVYLCGIGGGGFNGLHACDPCVVDGVVYLPTGRGVLAALNAADGSVRWLLRYDRVTRKRSASSWSTPQVTAVGDALLLAPADADQLLCIDPATARIRWTAERGQLQDLVAASDRLVWLAGQQVIALGLADGRPVWNQSVSPLAGRAALAGDLLYVPTVDGLVALDAATGRPVDSPKTFQPDVMGNLLAFDAALYVTDGLTLRKFPDLAAGYDHAVARHRADPADGSRAIRLAALELLRGRPTEALAALEPVPPVFAKQDPHRYHHLIHLRVTALLQLAGLDATSAEKARTLLEQANRIAATSRDVIDAALALADFHLRQGRALDACNAYLSLMLSPSGDELIAEDDTFDRRARERASDRLSLALEKLPPAEAAAFRAETRDRLADAVARGDESQVLRFSESEAIGSVAAEASLQLAAWAIEAGRFEPAQSLLTRVLNRADDPRLRAEAAARLAIIALQPDELTQPVAAAGLLDQLTHDYASIALKTSILGGLPDYGPEVGAPAETITAARLASLLRPLLDPRLLARYRRWLAPARLGPPNSAEAILHPEAQPVVLHDEPLEPLLGKQLLLVGQDRLEVLDADNGKLLWPVELRLLSEWSVQSQTVQENLVRSYPRRSGRYINRARALLDGQTLLITSPLGLHAIGALTGRRLWSRPYEPPCLPNQDPADSDAWFWVDDGFLMTLDARGQLEVSRTESGRRILWRRSSPRKRWHWVRARSGYLIAMDDDLEQVDLYRLRNGAAVGQCRFTQPPGMVSVTLFKEVICGPISDREVAAFELATPGVRRWRFAMDQPLAQIFKPTPDLLAISDRAGHLALVDPTTGIARWRTTVEACAAGVTDGVVQDSTLYLCGLNKRPDAGHHPNVESQRWGVAAVRLADGEVIWQHGDLAARTHLNADVLRLSDNAIPLAAYAPARGGRAHSEPINPRQDADNASPLVSRVELSFLDKTTGRQIGGAMSSTVADSSGAGLILDLRARPGLLDDIIGTNTVRIACPPKANP